MCKPICPATVKKDAAATNGTPKSSKGSWPEWGRLLKGSIYPKSPDNCPSCGEHVTTMGELLDATIEQVATILQRGLDSGWGTVPTARLKARA
jgi:hypothetical protein